MKIKEKKESKQNLYIGIYIGTGCSLELHPVSLNFYITKKVASVAS